jgi:hypothetical protein
MSTRILTRDRIRNVLSILSPEFGTIFYTNTDGLILPFVPKPYPQSWRILNVNYTNNGLVNNRLNTLNDSRKNAETGASRTCLIPHTARRTGGARGDTEKTKKKTPWLSVAVVKISARGT